MRLRWTTPAAQDLYRIVQHIQEDHPSAAAEVAKTIYEGCGTLRDFPRRGRGGRIPGTRELIFPAFRTSLSIRLRNRASKFYASTTAHKIGRRCRCRQMSPCHFLISTRMRCTVIVLLRFSAAWGASGSFHMVTDTEEVFSSGECRI